jgi:hypothetical protein
MSCRKENRHCRVKFKKSGADTNTTNYQVFSRLISFKIIVALYSKCQRMKFGVGGLQKRQEAI